MTAQDVTPTVELKEQVRQRYGQIAQGVLAGGNGAASCCGPTPIALADGFALDAAIPLQATAGCCSSPDASTTAGLLYAQGELSGLPASVTSASLGCGNPTAIAALRPGQTVLDLGSGGGIDCFLAARQVGPSGQVIGLDMTEAMLALAERNKASLGDAAANVRFLRGEIEAIPLPDGEVDVIISNCVINLSLDKDAVFREAFGCCGRAAIWLCPTPSPCSPSAKRCSATPPPGRPAPAARWTVETYRAKLHAAGFSPIEISDVTPTDFGLSEGVDDGAAAVAATWPAASRVGSPAPRSWRTNPG
jgi:arsenite methyltransferase